MPLNPLVGPVCLCLGVIGLALGIHDRITRSVFYRRYLVATYSGQLASRLVRTAPFWRLPFGICLMAAGLALTLGHGPFLGILWLVAGLAGVVAATGYARPIPLVKPAWFRREELNGYPILQTPEVAARRPLFIWIMSIAVFIPLGLV